MEKLFRNLIIAGLLISLWACMEIRPLTAPKDPPLQGTSTRSCQAPPIEQNIIGSWQTGYRQSILGDTISKLAPFTTSTFTRFGSLTFDKNKQVADPDSLFENYIAGWGPVKSKLFSVETDTTKNGTYYQYREMVWVRQYAKNKNGVTGYAQGYFFKVIANECNRIHLKGPAGAMELVLMRK